MAPASNTAGGCTTNPKASAKRSIVLNEKHTASASWSCSRETPAAIEQRLRTLAEQRGVAAGKIFQPIRIALTGVTVSEPVNELLYVVGKDAALKRLEQAAVAGFPG